MNETLIGAIAGTLTAVSAIPQLIKVIRKKKANDISPVMFFILLAGTGMWVYYGIMKDDLPIIITNAFSSLITICMLFCNYRYSK